MTNLNDSSVLHDIFRFEQFLEAKKNINSLTVQDIAHQRPLWSGRNPGKIYPWTPVHGAH